MHATDTMAALSDGAFSATLEVMRAACTRDSGDYPSPSGHMCVAVRREATIGVGLLSLHLAVSWYSSGNGPDFLSSAHG